MLQLSCTEFVARAVKPKAKAAEPKGKKRKIKEEPDTDGQAGTEGEAEPPAVVSRKKRKKAKKA